MKNTVILLGISVAGLALLGVMMQLSAGTYAGRWDRFQMHLCWLGLGLAVGLTLACVDYARWRRLWILRTLLGLSFLLLAAVFVPGVGVVANGAARWLWIGQPSELAKVALVAYLAYYISEHWDRMAERNTGFLYPMAISAGIAGLIFLEPDWGTAALVSAVSLALLGFGGAHWGYLVSAVVIGSELFVLLLLRNPLRLERVLVFLDPEKNREGVGWQGWHSLLALGSGGWFGAFFGEGRHKNGFVPEQQTDFVASLVGEELGLAGMWLVLLLFTGILLCGARIAWRSGDPFGKLLAAGLTLLITFQALINLGVVTSSLPNKGMALPFVSYGGSNLVCLCAAVGLLISVAWHGPWEPPASENQRRPKAAKTPGPTGSLLYSSVQDEARGWWGKLRRRRRIWRASKWQAPRHDYQRPPRPPAGRNGETGSPSHNAEQLSGLATKERKGHEN